MANREMQYWVISLCPPLLWRMGMWAVLSKIWWILQCKAWRSRNTAEALIQCHLTSMRWNLPQLLTVIWLCNASQEFAFLLAWSCYFSNRHNKKILYYSALYWYILCCNVFQVITCTYMIHTSLYLFMYLVYSYILWCSVFVTCI